MEHFSVDAQRYLHWEYDNPIEHDRMDWDRGAPTVTTIFDMFVEALTMNAPQLAMSNISDLLKL